VCRAAVFVLALALVPQVSGAQSARYAGRPLSDVLIELRTAGLNLVFSPELVRPELRVVAEPRSERPRQIVDELLRPHGLAVREAARGRLTVVRQRPSPAPQPGGGAPPGTVRGRVIDARTSVSLSGSLVQIEATAQRAFTDADGRFEIPNVPAGSQRLLVSLVGYALVRRDLVIAPASITELLVPLAEGAGTYVESVTVKASAFEEAEVGVASQTVLGSRDLLALRGVLADDPQRAVQALPGVATGDDFRAEFAVRGHGPQHLGSSVDGIDSRLLFHTVRGVENAGSVGLINSDILESVSVVAGVRPQRMHASLGAAVDFTTRDGASDRLRVRGLISATSASTVWEGPAGRRATWLVAARQSYIDWVLRAVDPDGAGTFGFTDAQAKLTWSPSPSHSFRALVLGGRSLLHEPDHSGPNALDTGANRTVAGSLQWRFTPSTRFEVNQQLYAVSADYENVTPQGAVREGGSDLDLTWRGGVAWSSSHGRLEAGAQAQHLSADREAREFTFQGPASELALSGDTANFAGWVHMAWSVAPRLTLSPGARVDRSGLADSTFVSPWLLAEWQLTARTRLRAGAGVQHQLPLVEQAHLAPPGVTLAPERARGWDVGLDHVIGGDWRVSTAVYHRRESDLLRLIGVEPFVADGAIVAPTRPQWENTVSGRASGVGLTVERRQANGFSGWLAYSYGRFDVTDDTRNESFPADFDQRHTVNTYASYQWSGRMSVSGRWRYGSNFPLQGYYEQRGIDYFLSTERNRERLPLYSRVDVRVDRTFTRQRSRLTLFVEVLNLFNRTNQGRGDLGYNPVTGRVPDLVEDLFPLLPTAGLLIEF
jgi:hypothetical protein